MSEPLHIRTFSPEETQALGRLLGEGAQPGDVFLLSGPLGAGKTCLTQGIAWGAGVAEKRPQPYLCYNDSLPGPADSSTTSTFTGSTIPWRPGTLGLDEQIFGDGICVVEWAERAEEVFPPECLWIELDYSEDGDGRTLSITDAPSRYQDRLESLRTFARELGSRADA